ncbi:MAG: hypothetical protein WBG66_22695, partial [Geitlerinemataceae cyanobacterium]
SCNDLASIAVPRHKGFLTIEVLQNLRSPASEHSQVQRVLPIGDRGEYTQSKEHQLDPKLNPLSPIVLLPLCKLTFTTTPNETR